MLHLMKLELKKFNLLSYVFGVFVASNELSWGLSSLFSFIEKAEGAFIFYQSILNPFW